MFDHTINFIDEIAVVFGLRTDIIDKTADVLELWKGTNLITERTRAIPVNTCHPDPLSTGYIIMYMMGGRCHRHRVVVNKSSSFIGSRFPAVQFWFPVECSPELCARAGGVRSMYRRRSCRRPVQMTTTGPFVRSANVICRARGGRNVYNRRAEGRVSGGVVVKAAPTHLKPTYTHIRAREHTHTHVVRNVFLTVEKKSKVYACGWRKIWFEVYMLKIPTLMKN